jgi:hypothetical protein
MYSYIHLTCFTFCHIYTVYTRPLSIRAQYSRLCPISGSLRYNGRLVTWTVVCLTAAKFKPLVFSVTGFALSKSSPSPVAGPRYIASAQTAQKTPLSTVTLVLRVTQPLPGNVCIPGSTVMVLSKYATSHIYIYTYTYSDAYPLLGNGPVNTFPLKHVTTIGRPLLGNVSVNTPGQQ